jgi:hypothetical protein
MKQPRPCDGVKRSDCRFTEDQYVKSNRAPLMKPRPPTEAELRDRYRRHVAEGDIPPTCPTCGWAHP